MTKIKTLSELEKAKTDMVATREEWSDIVDDWNNGKITDAQFEAEDKRIKAINSNYFKLLKASKTGQPNLKDNFKIGDKVFIKGSRFDGLLGFKVVFVIIKMNPEKAVLNSVNKKLGIGAGLTQTVPYRRLIKTLNKQV
jgi:hypothetical protein